MRTIANLLKAVQSQDLNDIALQSMADTAPAFVAVQKDQLLEGFDSTDHRLQSYKSPKYATKKNSMNPLPGYGNPDLKLTGDFYSSIRADIDNDGLLISASDPKAPSLEKKYGNRIYTLSESFKPEYIVQLLPAFVARVTDSLKQK